MAGETAAFVAPASPDEQVLVSWEGTVMDTRSETVIQSFWQSYWQLPGKYNISQ